MSRPYILSRTMRLAVFTLAILSLVVIPGAISPTVAQGSVLLDEQFNDNSHNWKLATAKDSKLTVGDGVLSIAVRKTESVGWATPDMTFADDIDIRVETSTPSPSTTGNWNSAIVFRADTRDLSSAFYQFQVMGKGQWAFVTRTANGDEYKVEKSGALKNYDPVGPNTLEVSARGTTFAFSVNGSRVLLIEDDRINNDPSMPKYIGLLAGTYEGTDNITVEFRNLTVTAASDSVPSATSTRAGRTPTKAGSPTRTPRVTATPVKPGRTPTRRASATPNVKAILKENFTNDNPNGWTVGKTENTNRLIQDGALHVEITKESLLQWSFPRTRFPANVDVTVTVTNLEPDPAAEWSYGIGLRGFRDNDGNHFYLFETFGTGKWAFSTISGEGDLKTNAIVKLTTINPDANFDPEGTNTLRARVVGSHFEFYVNGAKVGEADDDSLEAQKSNLLMLVASTSSKTPVVKAAFSDLTVTEAR